MTADFTELMDDIEEYLEDCQDITDSGGPNKAMSLLYRLQELKHKGIAPLSCPHKRALTPIERKMLDDQEESL